MVLPSFDPRWAFTWNAVSPFRCDCCIAEENSFSSGKITCFPKGSNCLLSRFAVCDGSCGASVSFGPGSKAVQRIGSGAPGAMGSRPCPLVGMTMKLCWRFVFSGTGRQKSWSGWVLALVLVGRREMRRRICTDVFPRNAKFDISLGVYCSDSTS